MTGFYRLPKRTLYLGIGSSESDPQLRLRGGDYGIDRAIDEFEAEHPKAPYVIEETATYADMPPGSAGVPAPWITAPEATVLDEALFLRVRPPLPPGMPGYIGSLLDKGGIVTCNDALCAGWEGLAAAGLFGREANVIAAVTIAITHRRFPLHTQTDTSACC